MVEKRGRFGRKNGKGFYDYPEKGKGQKSLWRGLGGCSRSSSIPTRST
jgi:3-hydroxyacyl-CoA dehydrogenase/enoyl-CoA hydratase/3-hydroxybutyryl-CoA epimerase